jgi:DNA-directed RNA polymerase specialized sigma24 family protein
VSAPREHFEHVYQDCYEAVQRYAARRVAPEAIQDVVSETFLTAWRRYEDLNGEPLRRWFAAVRRAIPSSHGSGSPLRSS